MIGDLIRMCFQNIIDEVDLKPLFIPNKQNTMISVRWKLTINLCNLSDIYTVKAASRAEHENWKGQHDMAIKSQRHLCVFHRIAAKLICPLQNCGNLKMTDKKSADNLENFEKIGGKSVRKMGRLRLPGMHKGNSPLGMNDS